MRHHFLPSAARCFSKGPVNAVLVAAKTGASHGPTGQTPLPKPASHSRCRRPVRPPQGPTLNPQHGGPGGWLISSDVIHLTQEVTHSIRRHVHGSDRDGLLRSFHSPPPVLWAVTLHHFEGVVRVGLREAGRGAENTRVTGDSWRALLRVPLCARVDHSPLPRPPHP